MKKTTLAKFSLVFFIGIIGLSSCGFLQSEKTEDNYRRSDKLLDQVLSALETQDKELLLDLFSEDAKQAAENIDEGINYIFELFSGEIQEISLYGGTEYSDYDHGNISSTARYSYFVTTDEEKYFLFLYSIPHNTADSEKIGLYMLQFIKAEDKETLYSGGYKDIRPGIYMPDNE